MLIRFLYHLKVYLVDSHMHLPKKFQRNCQVSAPNAAQLYPSSTFKREYRLTHSLQTNTDEANVHVFATWVEAGGQLSAKIIR